MEQRPYLRLSEASKQYGFSISALRKERDKGNLLVSRIGGIDYTTHKSIQEMFEQCRVKPNHHASFLEKEKVESPSSSYSTEERRLALVSARNIAQKLKKA